MATWDLSILDSLLKEAANPLQIAAGKVFSGEMQAAGRAARGIAGAAAPMERALARGAAAQKAVRSLGQAGEAARVISRGTVQGIPLPFPSRMPLAARAVPPALPRVRVPIRPVSASRPVMPVAGASAIMPAEPPMYLHQPVSYPARSPEEAQVLLDSLERGTQGQNLMRMTQQRQRLLQAFTRPSTGYRRVMNPAYERWIAEQKAERARMMAELEKGRELAPWEGGGKMKRASLERTAALIQHAAFVEAFGKYARAVDDRLSNQLAV